MLYSVATNAFLIKLSQVFPVKRSRHYLIRNWSPQIPRILGRSWLQASPVTERATIASIMFPNQWVTLVSPLTGARTATLSESTKVILPLHATDRWLRHGLADDRNPRILVEKLVTICWAGLVAQRQFNPRGARSVHRHPSRVGEAKWGEGRWGSPPEIVVIDDRGFKHHFRLLMSNRKLCDAQCLSDDMGAAGMDH